MTVDPATGALLLSIVTAVGLIFDKYVLRMNSRDSTKVQGQTATATAAQTEQTVEINWRHEASSMQKELHQVRNEMLDLKRDFRNLQLDFDVVTGKLTACQRENLLLREIADFATDARDKWRLSAKSWLQVVEDGGREPEYKLTAGRLYVEALNADDAEKAREAVREAARQSALAKAEEAENEKL